MLAFRLFLCINFLNLQHLSPLLQQGNIEQHTNNTSKMKTYSTKDIRNVVLIGSTRSGKTTLSEAMLYEGKVIDRRGSVEAKNTVSDNSEIEQLNQRSIYATPLYAEFMDTKFNIIDAPGADDFVGGAVSAFRVCDTAILVTNGQLQHAYHPRHQPA